MPLTPESSFVDGVLELVEDIPPGRVMTYGDIAAVFGSRGARLVGQIMARYGADVPWWRVIRAGGHPPIGHEEPALVHYRAEGTPVTPSSGAAGYRIDFAAARWSPGQDRTTG
jgi:alkylated DNA nucleotide flippase Atl1